jgi:hypothetical protein
MNKKLFIQILIVVLATLTLTACGAGGAGGPAAAPAATAAPAAAAATASPVVLNCTGTTGDGTTYNVVPGQTKPYQSLTGNWIIACGATGAGSETVSFAGNTATPTTVPSFTPTATSSPTFTPTATIIPSATPYPTLTVLEQMACNMGGNCPSWSNPSPSAVASVAPVTATTQAPVSTATRTPAPTNTPVPASSPAAAVQTEIAAPVAKSSAPMSLVLDPTDWSYFSQFSAGFTDPAMHGALIDRLDTLYLNIKRVANGGKITTNSSDVVVFWSADYINENPMNGKAIKYLVDGDTGVWLVKPNTTVDVPSGYAYVQLKNWNGEVSPREGIPALAKGHVQANACVPNTQVVPTVQSMLGQEPLFAKLDIVANGNTDARLRNGWYATIKAVAGKSMIWVKSGEVGLGWAKVTEADGISLYVAKVSGDLDVMYPFSGVALCDTYPNYQSLTSVVKSAAPAEQTMCIPNDDFAAIVNESRKTTDLYLRLALLPSATHPAGTYNTLWNTFTVTMDEVAGTNQQAVDWTQTSDGFRALYFTTTDGTSTFAGQSATITPCTGGFDLAKAFEKWWGLEPVQ